MSKRPNIVIVLSDQQRWDTLGYCGIWKDVTPNLDEIGKEGAIFNNCFSVQPVCGPARACIQSGRFATETDNYKNGRTLPPSPDNMAEKLRASGYDTAYIGKWHCYKDHGKFGYDVPPAFRAGYDYWLASNALEFTSAPFKGILYDNRNHKVRFKKFRVEAINDFAVDYVRTHSGEKPFFLMVSHLEPHHQNNLGKFVAPKEYREKFVDANYPDDLVGQNGDYVEGLPDYLGTCNYIDKTVGDLVSALKEKEVWDNTLFIYSSDHGCHFKTRNWEYKRSCHDASTRIPLVIHGGEFNGKGVVDGMASLTDIAPTVLYAAGIERPACYRGEPLQTKKEGGDVFIQISEAETARALRTSKYTYCVSADKEKVNAFAAKDADEYFEEYLYDNEKDPAQRNNLVEDPEYTEAKEKLKTRLMEYISTVEGKTPRIYRKKEYKKYGLNMSVKQMLADEKAKKALQKHFKIFTTAKSMTEGTGGDLPLSFIAGFIEKIPFMKIKIKALKKDLDALNEE